MALNKPFYHTIAEKLWPGVDETEKNKLFELLVPLVVFFFAALLHLIFRLFQRKRQYCLIM
jgi:hypothetical protein